jgi:hypothetical protein
VDPGEECDPASVVVAWPCAGSPSQAPLSAPEKPYTAGEATQCLPTCRYDRTACSYCGDGVRDDTAPVDGGIVIAAEWCDGDAFDEDRLVETFGNLCPDEDQRPSVGCGADCRSFEELDAPTRCCVRDLATCPSVADDVQCCQAYLHPDAEPCTEFFDGEIVRRVCGDG